MRVVKGNSYILPSPTFVGDDGESSTACDSLPTCTVAREDGAALTAAAVTQVDAGDYSAAITTTHTAALDVLTVTWTGLVSGETQVYTDTVEVVGGHYVTIPELRNMPGLENTTKFPVELLREMRDEFETTVENVCGVAFVRRYQRDLVDGSGCHDLRLTKLFPRTVLGVTINGTTITETFDLFNTGAPYIRRRGNLWTRPDESNGYRNCAVKYEHAMFDRPPPDLKRAALKTIRMDVLAQAAGGVPANTISQQYEGTTIRFSTPDPAKGRPTGVLHLDPILVRYDNNVLGLW